MLMNQDGSMSADNTIQVGGLNSNSLLIKLETIINDIADLSLTLSLYPILKKGIESPDYSDKLKKINKKLKSLEEAIPENVLEDVENLLSAYVKLESLSQYLKILDSTSNLLLNLDNSTVLNKILSIISSDNIDLTGYVKTELLGSFVTELDANSTYKKKSDFDNDISNYLTKTLSDAKYVTIADIENEIAELLSERINTTSDLLNTLTAISNLINENTVSDILEIQNYKNWVDSELLDWEKYDNLVETLDHVLVCNTSTSNHLTTYHSEFGGPFHYSEIMAYKTRIYNVTPGTTLKIETNYVSGIGLQYKIGVFYKLNENDLIEKILATQNDPFSIGFTENNSFEVVVPDNATFLAITRHNNNVPGVYIKKSNIFRLQLRLNIAQPTLEAYRTNYNNLDVYRINHNDGDGNSWTFWFRKTLLKENLFDYNCVNCERVNYTNLDAVSSNFSHRLLISGSTDIIGPIAIQQGLGNQWYGGAHLYYPDPSNTTNRITAKTESYSVKVDGVEVELSNPILGNVCEITVVNKIGDYDELDNLTNLLLTETRIYTIIKNKMKVRVTHEFANNAVGKTISLYYGMQANLKANDKILTVCGKHPNFIPNTDRRTFTKSEFPKFLKFVLRSELSETKDITTSVWLNPNYGIGNHCYISDNDPIFISAYSSNPNNNAEKSYHVLIKNLPITEGLIYSWEGVYTFENDSDLHVTEYYSDLVSNN